MKLKRLFSRAVTALSAAFALVDSEDLLFFAGTFLVGTGLWLIHPAAALITVGIILILAVKPARRWF
jgi:hypothetical protein